MILPIRSVVFTPVNPVTPVRGIDGARETEQQVEAAGERPKRQPRPRRNNAGLATATVSPGVFDPGNFDTTPAKFDLIERAGQMLGVALRDFPSMTTFLRAMAAQAPAPGTAGADAVEAGAGLTALGLSLGDLIEALRDPLGRAAATVDAALRRRANAEAPQDDPHARLDELGLYGG